VPITLAGPLHARPTTTMGESSNRSRLHCPALPVRYSAGKGGPPSNHPLHTSRRHCRCEGPWQCLLRLVHQVFFYILFFSRLACITAPATTFKLVHSTHVDGRYGVMHVLNILILVIIRPQQHCGRADGPFPNTAPYCQHCQPCCMPWYQWLHPSNPFSTRVHTFESGAACVKSRSRCMLRGCCSHRELLLPRTNQHMA
jgi:hypothetical protein